MKRTANITRNTKETSIVFSLNLDGGDIQVDTGIGFFDHMLKTLFFYAGFGAQLTVRGDLHVDGHHTVEDTGIVLGQALKEALGDKAGIRRFADCYVPMDEALCFTALDLGGRPYLVFEADRLTRMLGEYDATLTEEFMRAVAVSGGITLHMRCNYGKNTHHIVEGLFKSLGLALRDGVCLMGETVFSTKGVLA